ncbi:hypothetical protein F0562_011744 [Nyssa sinensis]|uniref:Uncharacterized protein n=1 Tax=Nyssa sinensis TaxID=561372 RepID=A0A5J4ZQD4_9ASTE|nr:hypothetical protein F0562_011744 [Nyssa sinensis]
MEIGFRCRVEFLQPRLLEDLQGQRSKLTGSSPSELPSDDQVREEARKNQEATIKMGQKFMGRGYNICVKKLIKILLDFDLNHLDVVNLPLEELDDDEEDVPPTS